jgi:CheY-like chemotaxis protein
MERHRTQRPLKVLAVDDEQVVLDTFCLALEPRGHEVVTATNGHDAIAAVRDSDFDVAFVDVAMQPLDGAATVKYLREIAPRLRIVMMTAFCSPEIPPSARRELLRETQSDGTRACLRKPFDLTTIARTAEYIAG